MSHPTDPLIAAWLADDLDAEGVRTLEEHLRRDPTARERFARFCQSESVLPQALATAPVRPGTTGLRRAVRGASRRMRPRRPVGRFGWVLPLTAAAALVVVVVTVGVMRSTPAPAVAAAGPLELIAVQKGSGDTVLSDGRPLGVGTHAPRGALVEVRGPGVVFRWRDGTRLEAVAATTLRVTDGATAVQVEAGSLTAQVTSRTDRPFRIDTPHASAVVMGTRFALGVGAGHTALTVSEGRVRFSAGGDAVREVIAGESALADAGGLEPDAGVRVTGFVPTARDVTRVLGPRLVRRGTLRLADLPTDGINLRLECLPGVGSVRTGMRGVGSQRLEQVRDYFVFGDVKNRASTAWAPRAGTFIIDAQPFADADGREPLGPAVVFELTIVP